VRLYDRLFSDPAPASHKSKDFKDFINPDSLNVMKNCILEPVLKDALPEQRFQFQRLGYFVADRYCEIGKPVFNRTVPLRDNWSKKSNKK
jgi:glutaminyl-tRNA synthetase